MRDRLRRSRRCVGNVHGHHPSTGLTQANVSTGRPQRTPDLLELQEDIVRLNADAEKRAGATLGAAFVDGYADSAKIEDGPDDLTGERWSVVDGLSPKIARYCRANRFGSVNP